MNRRSFFKKIAAVAAGVVIIPTVLANKNAEDPMLLAFRRAMKNTKFKRPLNGYQWAQIKGYYYYKDPPEDFLNEVSHSPKHELGSYAYTGDGRVYRYMKNCTTEQLIQGHYVNYPKNNLHN